MCGRYLLVTPLDELVDVFDVEVPTFDHWPQRYNIAPTQRAPTILLGDGGERRMGLLRWGLIPSWAKDPSIGNRMINARSETASSKPAFRTAFARRRCLVPMSGFYEWRKGESGKTPFLIRPPGGAPFSVAGLWESWEGPDGERLSTFTILTTAASRWMTPLHDRMPAVLDASAAVRWLDPATDREELEGLLRPAAESTFEAFEVSRAVNVPTNDRPEVSEPMPGGERIPQGIGGGTDTPG